MRCSEQELSGKGKEEGYAPADDRSRQEIPLKRPASQLQALQNCPPKTTGTKRPELRYNDARNVGEQHYHLVEAVVCEFLSVHRMKSIIPTYCLVI